MYRRVVAAEAVLCRQSVRRSVGASHLSPRGQRADELASPSFA